MIDLHCHLLPAVDDGSRTVAQSVRVLEGMAAKGVTTVCLTPHLAASAAVRGVPAAHDTAFAALVAEAPPSITLKRGVEMLLDRPLAAVTAANRALTLGGTRFMLVEFTRMVTASSAATALAQIVRVGLVPVLAHPERYVSCSTAVVRQWKEAGALIQVDATTILRPSSRGQRARALLAEGLADILAADNHGDDRGLPQAVEALNAQDADAQADLLTTRNPQALLADEYPDVVPPVTFRLSLLNRLKAMLDGDE